MRLTGKAKREIAQMRSRHGHDPGEWAKARQWLDALDDPILGKGEDFLNDGEPVDSRSVLQPNQDEESAESVDEWLSRLHAENQLAAMPAAESDVLQRMEELPAEQLEVLVQRYVEGMTVREIQLAHGWGSSATAFRRIRAAESALADLGVTVTSEVAA